MVRVLIFWCVVLTCSGIVKGQSSAAAVDWQEAAQESESVVMGMVEGVAWVIDPAKQRVTISGSAITDLPNPSEYVLGRVVRLRVSEVLKSHGKVKRGGVVSVFLPGRVSREGEPVILERQNYLLFLGRLRPGGDRFAGAKIVHPESRSGSGTAFDPMSHYALVLGGKGAIEINQKNRNLIKEVKTAIRQ